MNLTTTTNFKNLIKLDSDCPTYKQGIDRFNRFMIANPQLTIFNFFDNLKSQFRPATVITYKAGIKKAMRESLRREGRDTVENINQLDLIFKAIKPGKPDKKIGSNKTMSESEIDKFKSQAGTKTTLILDALYETACRVSELINIKYSDCQETSEIVNGQVVKGVAVRILGKGSKERFVFLKSDTYQAIRQAYNGKVYLFETKGKQITRQAVHTLIKRVGDKIGRSDIHAHTIRHSFATTAHEKGLPLNAVSEYLGHSSYRTTYEFYLHSKVSMSTIFNHVGGGA